MAYETNENLFHAKLEAIQTVCTRVEQYRRHLPGADPLIMQVLKKKLSFLKEAASKTELLQIIDPKAFYPLLEFGIWKTGPYHIPEEEVLFWAIGSPSINMTSEAEERANSLYLQYVEPLLHGGAENQITKETNE